MIYVVIATTKERRPRLQKCLEALRNSTIEHSVLIYENNDGGCVLATKKAIDGLNGLIFLLNDDMIVEPRCLEMLSRAYEIAFPNHDGLCQPYEDIQKGELAVSPFCHTDTLRPFLNHYTHNFWDTEFTLVMRSSNKYAFVPGAILDHQHHVKDNKLMDETYKKNTTTYNQDREIFNQRSKNGFKD